MKYSEDRLCEIQLDNGQSRQLHVWGSRNPGPVLLCVHGGMAHGGDYLTMGVSFRAYDFTTVSIDLSGHLGQQRVYVDSFDDFVQDVGGMMDWAQSEYPERPWFLVGHSMGGLILSYLALRQDLSDRKGFSGLVLSSPYWSGVVKVPWYLKLASGLVSKLTPTANVPLEDFVDHLTHDEAITQRHRDDEASDRRAREISARFGREMLKAQRYVAKHVSDWSHPVYLVSAGKDKLSSNEVINELCAMMPEHLVTHTHYPENYHENFNELNREEVFAGIRQWMGLQIDDHKI